MKKKSFLKKFGYLIVVLLLVSLVAAVVTVLSTQIVPARYLGVALPIYIVLNLVAVYLLMHRKVQGVGLAAALVLALALSAVNVGLYVMSQATGSFIGSLTQQEASYVEYTIATKKGSGVTLGSNGEVGLIGRDPLQKAVTKDLAKETKAKPRDYDNLTVLVNEVLSQEVDMLAVRTASLELVKTNAPETYDELVMLGTFKVKDTQHEAVEVNMAEPFVVYISGIDTHGSIDTTARSDVNMLAVINPVERKVLLVNTPRDYYVQLRGTSGLPDKLTHAGIYGVHTSRQTLEDLYDVKIPHYVRMNFTSLVKLIDTIGDIEVNSQYSFNSFSQGVNVLDSKRALEFARERYSFQDGDRQRGRNQQLVIEGIINKLSEPATMARYPAILNALEGTFQTNIGQQTIRQFINMQLDDMKKWQVESISVDGNGDIRPTYSMGATSLYVMVPDQQSVDAAQEKIQEYLAD